MALAFRLEGRIPLPALGVWLNSSGSSTRTSGARGGCLLRGLGIGLFLAAGYGRPGLAWALTPWPLLLYLRLDVREFALYLPALGEGMVLGALLYLAGFRRR
jgi:hypothetical protein